MSMTQKQLQVRNNLERLMHHRMTEQQLNEMLSKYFSTAIKVERGLYDEDWQGDDYFTCCVDDDEVGGYVDIYYLPMPNRPDYFYLTEFIICFDHVK